MKFTDAQNYAEQVIDAMKNGNIFSQDIISFEQCGDTTIFKVDSKKLVEKITQILNNPMPGVSGMSQPGFPDFSSICDMSKINVNFNLNLTIPESAKVENNKIGLNPKLNQQYKDLLINPNLNQEYKDLFS